MQCVPMNSRIKFLNISDTPRRLRTQSPIDDGQTTSPTATLSLLLSEEECFRQRAVLKSEAPERNLQAEDAANFDVNARPTASSSITSTATMFALRAGACAL